MSEPKKTGVKNGTEQKKDQPKTPAPPPAQKPVAAKTTDDKTLKLSDLAGIYLKRKELFDRQHGAIAARLAAVRKNIDRLTASAAIMEQKLAALVPPSARDWIFPLATKLAELFPGLGYDVTGPFGSAGAITITFFPKDATEEDRVSGKGCKLITLVTKTKDGGIGIRDYSKDSKAHQPGTQGYSDGLNFGVIQVPTDAATVNWFAQHVK